MASAHPNIDAVRAAVSSISSCTAATVTVLKDLLLQKDAGPVPSVSTAKSKVTTTVRSGQTKSTGGARTTATKLKAGHHEKDGLSEKEKASLATHVINVTLKSLAEAAKPPPATLGRHLTSADSVRPVRNAPRRSNSAPMTPLQPRSLNRVSTSPVVTAKAAKPASSLSNGTACLATVECTRVAFATLRSLQDSGRVTLPEMQLESGMSSFIGKLIGLGMLDHACKELRILKARLGGVTPSAAKTTNKKGATESDIPNRALSDLLDFGQVKASKQALALIIATQLQVLRILAAWKKPSYIETAVPYLRRSYKSSPLGLLIRLAKEDASERPKVARQMETLAQLLLSLTPSVSNKDDGIAVEERLNVSPETALEIQEAGIEARVQWWSLAGHKGDADKDITLPMSRCLSAYIRRTRTGATASYKLCRDMFKTIHDLLQSSGFAPTRATKSPLAAIYQMLATLSREARLVEEAISWAEELRTLLDSRKDSAAKICSIASLILSLYLKDPSKYIQEDTSVLAEVLQGIQGPLKGDTTELEELLGNVCLVRKSAMGILVSTSDHAPRKTQQISSQTKQLLEEFICQCPRFCLRWLGKPPASKSSTKDFLRYEQRRQLLAKSMNFIFDSTFIVLKTLIEEKRVEWDQTNSILADSMTLLEYLGDLEVSSPAASYQVKVSHFYYLCYNTLRQGHADTKTEAMRALRHSIDCVKHRPSEEKEKAQLISKLERMAEICVTLGYGGEALGALQSIRTSLVDDGALHNITERLSSEPPLLAWPSEDRAAVLSRTLVTISKLEQVHIDWTVEMPELEQAAILEHRLHFILLGSTRHRQEVTLTHPCIDSLLRIYYPTRFPVRRLRTLLRLFSVNIDKPDILIDVKLQATATIGLIERQDFGEDSALVGYLPYYQTLYASFSGLSEGYLDLETLNGCLSSWDLMIGSDPTEEEVTKQIDDVSELLTHLKSIADFARTMGHDSILTTALELSAKAVRISPKPREDDLIKHNSTLAAHYISLSNTSKAQSILHQSQLLIEGQANLSAESMASFHIAFAECHIAIGSLEKANHHLALAKSVDKEDVPQTKLTRSQRALLVALASLLQSFIALEKGDAHHALVHSTSCVRTLFQKWKSLENACTIGNSSDRASDGPSTTDPEIDTSSSIEPLRHQTSEASSTASPEFWALFHPLFRGTLRLSFIYAHLGLFQETLYYAEQARKIASSTNATFYLSQSESWLSSVWLRAGQPEKMIELAIKARSGISEKISTCSGALIACELSGVYGGLKDHDVELELVERAEDMVNNLANGRKPDGTGTAIIIEDVIEQKMSKLSIKDKPKAGSRKPKATSRRMVQPKTAPAKSKPTPELKQPTPVEGIAVSTLEAAILIRRMSLLVNRRDWSSAMSIINGATLPKCSNAVLAERVAMASCLVGLSIEQMSKDAVFSVVHDSTLAFPSVCSSSSDKAERLSLTKSSPPNKGRVSPASMTRDMTKEGKAPGFLENLKEAQECLVEAHSLAAVAGDGGAVHRISGMLQSVVILLSAATSAKSRVMGHPGYATFSMEIARNLTWRRERKALLLEKSSAKMSGQDWPTIVTSPDPRRSSLEFSLDLNRVQRDYIDIIPKEWNVISISLTDNKHDLCITRFQAGHSPFVIRLPLERASSRDADNEVFNFQQGRSELTDIIKAANSSCHDARDMTAKGARSEWWEEREALEARFEDLLTKVESVWLGGFKGIFSRHPRRSDLLVQFQKSFQSILDKHLPSRRQVRGKRTKASPPSKVTLDSRVLELFIGLGDSTTPGCDMDDALNDLLYFVVDILQFHGERNAYDEIDFDSMAVETLDALQSYHTAVKGTMRTESGQHTILVLDKALHVFPWESLPCLKGLAVSRVPSLACLRRLIVEQDTTPAEGNPDGDAPTSLPNGHRVSPSSGTYILNPSSDLKSTQSTFAKPLASLGSSWSPIVSKAPTEAEFEAALTDRDILLYFGHGSGAQYIRGRTIRKLDKCRAAALLMGCSSASLTYNGEFEVNGPAWNYMLAGSPAVVGTLWDVTDKDIDRFAGRLFEEWGLFPRNTFNEDDTKSKGKGKGKAKTKRSRAAESSRRDTEQHDTEQTSLVEAVARARDAPRLRYLTGAAVCVYGIPVYIAKDKATSK